MIAALYPFYHHETNGYRMDLRIQKTYRALEQAFTKLLSENRYENISVAALCEEAMIRRTTFYKHFRDKDDYLVFFIDSLRREFLACGVADAEDEEGRSVQAERQAILRRLADFLTKHAALVENIFQSSMAGAMTGNISDAVADALRERYGEERSDEAEFAAGGIVRLMLLWWQSGHKADDKERFVHLSHEFLGRIMEG